MENIFVGKEILLFLPTQLSLYQRKLKEQLQSLKNQENKEYVPSVIQKNLWKAFSHYGDEEISIKKSEFDLEKRITNLEKEIENIEKELNNMGAFCVIQTFITGSKIKFDLNYNKILYYCDPILEKYFYPVLSYSLKDFRWAATVKNSAPANNLVFIEEDITVDLENSNFKDFFPDNFYQPGDNVLIIERGQSANDLVQSIFKVVARIYLEQMYYLVLQAPHTHHVITFNKDKNIWTIPSYENLRIGGKNPPIEVKVEKY